MCYPTSLIMAALVALLLGFALVPGNALTLPTGTYDYVVVGGGTWHIYTMSCMTFSDFVFRDIGTAGATLAARISEDPSVTVALLEAGDATLEVNPLAFIPGADVIGIGYSPLSAAGKYSRLPIFLYSATATPSPTIGISRQSHKLGQQTV